MASCRWGRGAGWLIGVDGDGGVGEPVSYVSVSRKRDGSIGSAVSRGGVGMPELSRLLRDNLQSHVMGRSGEC